MLHFLLFSLLLFFFCIYFIVSCVCLVLFFKLFNLAKKVWLLWSSTVNICLFHKFSTGPTILTWCSTLWRKSPDCLNKCLSLVSCWVRRHFRHSVSDSFFIMKASLLIRVQWLKVLSTSLQGGEVKVFTQDAINNDGWWLSKHSCIAVLSSFRILHVLYLCSLFFFCFSSCYYIQWIKTSPGSNSQLQFCCRDSENF